MDSPLLDVPLPIQYYYSTNYKIHIDKYNQKWKNSRSSKIPKLFCPKYDSKKTDYLLTLSRKDCGLIVGLTTGHCLIASFAKEIGRMTDGTCRKCKNPNVKETVEHIMCQCLALARTRGNTWAITSSMILRI